MFDFASLKLSEVFDFASLKLSELFEFASLKLSELFEFASLKSSEVSDCPETKLGFVKGLICPLFTKLRRMTFYIKRSFSFIEMSSNSDVKSSLSLSPSTVITVKRSVCEGEPGMFESP